MLKPIIYLLASFFGVSGPSLWWSSVPITANWNFVAAYLSVIAGLALMMYSLFCFKKYVASKRMTDDLSQVE